MNVSSFYNPLSGMTIIEDPNMVVPGETYEELRSLKERWFTLPWRPFKKTKTIVPMVPSKEIICWQHQFVMHPAMKQEFLKEMAKAKP